MKFKQLGIEPNILKALKEEGYTDPTDIQFQAIPTILTGQDLLGCAQTGTGKTAAFAVPTLQLLGKEKQNEPKKIIRALIITPTRELALQIHESFCTYGKYTKLNSCVIFGGVSQRPQEVQLKRGVDILVATPGRLNDLMQQRLIDISKVEIFILDEADRMLDMGFLNDVKKIITKLPEKRQTLLFSATMPKDIAKMADSILVNPAKIAVTPVSSTVDTIEQRLYYVDKGNKINLLIDILADKKIKGALVFTKTKHRADNVVKQLAKLKINAQAIHGNKSQGARQLALSNFKAGKLKVLVATDIAARGIDIDDLSHVINFELPDVPETYVHRIGRTGRAGQNGIAISFCDFDEKSQLADIVKLIGKNIPEIKTHPYPLKNNFLTEKPAKTGRSKNTRASNEKRKDSKREDKYSKDYKKSEKPNKESSSKTKKFKDDTKGVSNKSNKPTSYKKKTSSNNANAYPSKRKNSTDKRTTKTNKSI